MREQEPDGGRETVAHRRKAGRRTECQRDRRIRRRADMDIPLFSMAWIRLVRAGGAVSGGVNCSLRSSTETAETTTQITVTLLAQSLWETAGGAAALTRVQSTSSSRRYRVLKLVHNLQSVKSTKDMMRWSHFCKRNTCFAKAWEIENNLAEFYNTKPPKVNKNRGLERVIHVTELVCSLEV